MSAILEYDRGTIVVSNLAPSIAKAVQCQISWDPRIGAWRSPAHEYRRLRSQISSLCNDMIDRVRDSNHLMSSIKEVGLRHYQEAALLAWKIAGGQGIICLPTGAGKTRVALAAMERSKKATLCIVPTRVLLHQWRKEIGEIYKGEIGIIGDGQYSLKPITVATYESAFRNGWSFGNQFDLLIVDEVHHFGDSLRDEALEACTASFRLGLSATLEDSRMTNLNKLIGPVVFELRIDDLVGSALADFNLSCIHLPLTEAETIAYRADYAVFRRFFDEFKKAYPDSNWESFLKVALQSPSGRLAISAHGRAKRRLALTAGKEEMLCRLLHKHWNQRKLIFTSDSATALAISKKLIIAPITADVTRSERNRLADCFRDGKLKTLISCKVLNEGFDVPEAEVAIILGGSGSGREHIQRIGRVLRPKNEKKAQIYELLAAGTTEVTQSRLRGHSLDSRRYEKKF